MSVRVAGKVCRAFPGKSAAEREGMARERAAAKPVLPMIDYALARQGQCVVTREVLHDPGIVISPLEDEISGGIADLASPAV